MFNNLKSLFLIIFLITGSSVYAGNLYYCPMHPKVRSDKPGTCHICGMNLVKKESKEKSAEDAALIAGHAPVKLTAGQVNLMGVRTAVLKRDVLRKTVRSPGYISTSHELYQMQDQYVQAYLSYVTAFRDYERYKHAARNLETHRDVQLKLHEAENELLTLGLGHEQIAKLKKVSWKTPWNQPELLFFKEGFEYWVVAQVFENDLGFVEVGQEVEIEIPSYFEKVKGVVRSVGGIVDPEAHTANVLIELQKYRGELKGNMLVNVSILADLNEAAIVPHSAVMDTGLQKIVYVKVAPNTYEPREIVVSAPGDNGWMLKSGLKEGDEIVVDGNFLVDSESRLQSAIQGGGHD